MVQEIPVEDIKFKENMTVKELLDAFGKAGGFTAKKLYMAKEIVKKMISDKDSTNFLSFPACIIATGTRGAIVEMLKRKWFNVVITTVGTFDHDIARAFGNYLHGSFMLDDKELGELGYHRLGNVVVPSKVYGDVVEKVMMEILETIDKEEISTHELVWEIGKYMKEHGKEDSIAYWAYEHKIPVVIPGPYDGAVGSHVWVYQQDHKLVLNLFKDEQLLSDIIFTAKKTGALMLGGGISKHHVIWWNQYRDGLDYAVYITTAVEWDGSLSGARMREAISWHKLKPEADYVTVEGDVTVLLPMIVASLV